MKKNKYRTLNIKGTILDKYQLERYLKKIASDHIVQNNSNKYTYPIPNLKENYMFILKTYNLLNEHIKLGIDIHPAGEWILDNFYIIEETAKIIEKEISLKKYINLPGISNGVYKGFSRIFVLSTEIVAYTECKIDSDNLEYLIKAYQNKKNLSMDEIWYMQIFLQTAIIQNIKEICEKIYYSQIQKYKVENIIERLVEKKNTKEQKFNINFKYNQNKISYKEIKNPFIEHLSYKLKKYGKESTPYLTILEEQVNKIGTTIDEVIKKEHFSVAITKVLMKNCIESIKSISRIDFQEIFENINGVEEILKKDPANVYSKMDYDTKSNYRNKIKEISKKTKISEIYISKKVLELASKEMQKSEEINKKCHIGYYLISDGIYDLMLSLQYNKNINNNNSKIYILAFFLITILVTILLGIGVYINTKKLIYTILISIIIYVPISEIYIQILNYILTKFVKPKQIPKLDFSNGVPEEYKTIVVVPTIIKDSKKIKELFKKLEVFYLANKSENIYFALIGDCTSSKKEKEEFDEELIKTGIDEIEKLNNKYEEIGFPKFHFFYRKRTWCAGESCYLGWERKRGLLTQFNNFILDNKNDEFKYNSMVEWIKAENDNYENLNIPKIKYVITLDADTNLVLNTGLELIGAMAHILNKPILNDNENLVVSGHGIIQPRIGIDLLSCRQSLFTQIYAENGGTDSYSNAISDIYQDNFEEGIFTGKGIYDLEIFNKVLKEEIPENIVLSHDLLEGSYLRCGLATDIMLMDGYPAKYNSFMTRAHRWVRGDWQIIRWLFKNINNKNGNKHINPLNSLSKFKIFDNLRRETVPVFTIILFIIAILTQKFIWQLTTLVIITTLFPMIIDILNFIIFRKENNQKQRSFTNKISGISASIIREIFDFAFLPDKAYTFANAIIKTIFRLKSKKHLLEWITAEEAEKLSKTDLFSYYKKMFMNLVLGILCIIFSTKYILLAILGMLWLIAPIIAWYISKEKKKIAKIQLVSKEDKNYIINIANKTWKYFDEYINEENNYLPPDNYQVDRPKKIVNRTSSTNIGLGLLAVMSAYDFKFIDKNKTIDMLDKILCTINKLQKWNGHLYNWYNTKTLEPLIPRYVSTVDSGNFIGYLYVLKQFLLNLDKKNEKVEQLVKNVDNIIQNTDFKFLYSEKNRLFSIGFNIEENKLTDSYYDLLASEARQASLVAIAKKDISHKHWNNLNRSLTIKNGYKGLVSWSGTSFEYLMPNINIKKYPGSLLDESCKFMIMNQKEYAKKLSIAWGISESAYNLKDLNYNYQYKAFGIPWLGLKRGLGDDIVVASYGSILAIEDYPNDVIQNLKLLETQEMLGKYGFYEAIDYTPERLEYGKKYSLVKTYMAHHQALILLAINNLINNSIIQNRFTENPEIAAIDILLQERMPKNVIITKEKKEKVEKLKYTDYQEHAERIYTKIDKNLTNTNVISNDNYTIFMTDKGTGFSKYKNILINRYKQTADESQGILFYVKNIKSNRIWSNGQVEYLGKADKYKINFTQDSNKITRIDGNIETTTKVTMASDEPVEIRRIEFKNIGNMEETLEVTSYFEPVLLTQEEDYSHMAFNNLFLKYEHDAKTNSIIIKRKQRIEEREDVYLGVDLYTENETIGELEYEIDKEKFKSRTNINVPETIKNSKPLSKTIGLVTEPAVAMKRTIKVLPGETIVLNLIICISENREKVEEYLQEYKNEEKIIKTYQLSKAKIEAQNRYLGLKAVSIESYQKILSFILLPNPLRKLTMAKLPKRVYSQSELWKYGISGDLPIMLIKINNVNDIYVVDELLKAYEFFRIRNIYIDLVIIDNEENVYEQYVKNSIENSILNSHLMYLKNISGGIFVFNGYDLLKEDKELLEFRANLVIDASNGNVMTILKELEEEYLDTINNIGLDDVKINRETTEIVIANNSEPINNIENLKYYNEYGAFSKDGKEYLIKVNKSQKTPTVWSHIMANENFGTLVTENMGGFTWNENSRLNRISAWNNTPSTDIPSEIIYLKDMKNGKIWSLGNNPTPDSNEYYITYGFGYAKYSHFSDEILQELQVFVPEKDAAKVNILKLKNTSNQLKNIKLIYYIKPVLGEDEIKTDSYINMEKRNSNIICAKNLYNNLFNSVAYVGSSEKIKSYTGSKKTFIGSGNLEIPEGIKKVSLGNENSLGVEPCIAIELNIEIEAFQSKEISLVLGQEKTELDAENSMYKYTKISNCKEELNNIKQYWYQKLNKLQVNTPLESANIILNGWVAYQTIVCRLFARSAYYQSGGAIGFRDQLQDTLGLKFIDINLMKNQILKASMHQFIEGDVEHWWHEENKKGIRTKFSDDLLWLCYVTLEYINFTGDYKILDEVTPYTTGEVLEVDEDEKYDTHLQSEEKGSIYEHCTKAIEKALNFGENGLPKIGSGDWNDGFSTVGNKGKGESVWLGFFLYDILNRFIPICTLKQDAERLIRYTEIKDKLKKALNSNGWDGRWYKRAFTDDGDILGTIENEECKIDSIAQSWSIISGAGDNDKKYISLESLENHLLDKENGIIKLLDPPFDSGKLTPGYIKSYLPGVRENGGQYTHAAIWVIFAETMLGFGNKAMEYYRMINPIEHARTKETAIKYKVEPYVIAADVYGAGNLSGRGGWTWYTGSSSWFYKVGIENILGLKIEKGILKIEPCIPQEWKEYGIRYIYGKTIYNIKIKNPNGKNIGIDKFIVNREKIEEKEIKLVDDGKIYDIEVIM